MLNVNVLYANYNRCVRMVVMFERNHTCYEVNYCSDYKLSVQSAKEAVSDVSLKNVMSSNKHSFEYKRALNNFINSM